MKPHRLATLVLALTAAGAVHGQNIELTGNIPFGFMVSSKTMAAGDYKIDQDFASGTLVLRTADAKSSAIALVANSEPAGPREAPRLVFHRYGDRYFLSQVWIPNKYHSTFRSTPLEREFAAKVHNRGEVRLVALR